MANIFKTTLKKDIIADIANNDKREIRFPITKFWASRLTDEYNLDEKIFKFRIYDSLELSTPSNKDTMSERYGFDFVKTFVDGDEFVVEFKDSDDRNESCKNTEEHSVDNASTEDTVKSEETSKDEEDIKSEEVLNEDDVEIDNNSSVFNERNLNLIEITKGITFEVEKVIEDEDDKDGSDICEMEDEYISNEDILESVKYFFDEEKILDKICEDEVVFATNARQVIVLPNGRVLGSNKTLPVNNDVEVRIEFDMSHKIYFDSTDFDLYIFEDLIFDFLSKIKKNNFVFVWKRNTGIFKGNDGRVYFGIKYSTRKSIGFNRKYNVQ